MSPVIRISDNLYQRLEAYASGFDTPANVIETILNKYEGVPPSLQSSIKSRSKKISNYP